MVYLYITRSDGVAMLIGFVGAFIYYIIVNRKNDTTINLTSKKAILISPFIISLLAWLLVSQMANSGMQYGSAYDVVGIIEHLFGTHASGQNFVLGIKLFADELAYLIISSFFLLTVVIFYYITNYKKSLRTTRSLSATYTP